MKYLLNGIRTIVVCDWTNQTKCWLQQTRVCWSLWGSMSRILLRTPAPVLNKWNRIFLLQKCSPIAGGVSYFLPKKLKAHMYCLVTRRRICSVNTSLFFIILWAVSTVSHSQHVQSNGTRIIRESWLRPFAANLPKNTEVSAFGSLITLIGFHHSVIGIPIWYLLYRYGLVNISPSRIST